MEYKYFEYVYFIWVLPNIDSYDTYLVKLSPAQMSRLLTYFDTFKPDYLDEHIRVTAIDNNFVKFNTCIYADYLDKADIGKP